MWTISTSVLDRRATLAGTDPSNRPAMVLKPTGDDAGVLIALAAILGLVAFVNARALGGAQSDTTPATTNP